MTDRELTKLVERYSLILKPCFLAKINAFRNLRSSFKAAVEIAANGEEVDGTKNYHHLHWLFSSPRRPSLEIAVQILTENSDQLKRCRNFDKLHQNLTDLVIGIPNIGTVYCYDVALRIGAANEVLPEKIYLPSTPVRNAASKLEMAINADETIDVAALRLPLGDLLDKRDALSQQRQDYHLTTFEQDEASRQYAATLMDIGKANAAHESSDKLKRMTSNYNLLLTQFEEKSGMPYQDVMALKRQPS